MSEVPTFVIQRFWTEYKPDKNDPAKMVGEDWVAYGPLGRTDRCLTHSLVRHLSCVKHDAPDDDVAAQMAKMIWAIVEPRYNAWKSGQELPTDGTPLAAWNGISPEIADIFRSRGVRSVEDVSNLTDTHIDSFRIPGMRNIIKSAKLYLQAADTTRVAAELKKRDAEMEQLKEQVKLLSDQLMAKAEPKRGPGRPKKDEAEKVAI